jgi:serine/threonine-protein kinase
VESTQLLGGRYRLVERLGEGGTAVVWRAHDEILDRSVAIKVLSAGYASDARFRARIRAEARAAARLSHPHITNVHDYGESTSGDEPVPYVVMELLSGPTLAERMRSGPLPVSDALRIATQVAQALAAAHAGGLVHCDIKPANVVVTPDGAKVVDFGIAAVAGRKDPLDTGNQIWGTPAYVAPERLLGRGTAGAADVYALGILLYHALTGSLPWRAETATQMLVAHASEEPAPLPPIAGMPPRVAALCSRCLAKDPLDRPTAAQAARMLLAARAELGTETPAGSTGRWRGAAQVLIVLVAALIAGYWGLGGQDIEAPDAAPPGQSSGGPGSATGTGQPGPTGAGGTPGAGSVPAGEGPSSGVSGNGGASGGSAPGGGAPGGSASGGDAGSGDLPPADVGGGAGGDVGPVDRTVSTVGGTVVARCVGSTASIVAANPLAGFAVGDLDRGPAAQVGVTFNALLTTVRVGVRCSSGVPAASIEVG